jgi:nucleotide-binding universal stress UspA family protein
MAPVLCCLDDSDGARAAFAVARELAAKLGLELVLVHVEPPTAAPGVSAAPAGAARLREEELREGEHLLERLGGEAGLVPMPRLRTVVGNAASCIVSMCEEERAEFVVLGSRGRGGLPSALLGSVSSAVAARAPCPCVIVPPGAAAGEERSV